MLPLVAQELPSSRTRPIFGTREAARSVVGRGIPLPGRETSPLFDAAGHEVVWREVRRETDRYGIEHVFYRQMLAGPAGDVELRGSELGIHSRRDGSLFMIGGGQFDSVTVTNRPRLNRAEAALRANGRLRERLGVPNDAVGGAPIVDADRALRIEQTSLVLVQLGDVFRYAYLSYADDGADGFHRVVLDAETEELLGVGAANPSGNCFASTPTQPVTAKGVPLRSGLPLRSLMATPSSARPVPFTHEGYFRYLTVPMSVYQETSISAFKCDPMAARSYTLFPLRKDAAGVVVYDDYESWKGRAAGDALYNTYQTMQAFYSLGRDSWDGRNREAKIVIESTGTNVEEGDTGTDQARFIHTPKDSRTPAGAVVIGKPFLMHNLASSLDLVAHEWGHGVLFTGPNIPYDDAGNRRVHEGLSDVIAHIVEKSRQPDGFGPEQSSDWVLHEDAADGGYARGAEDDGAGHTWRGPNGTRSFNDRIHAGDAGDTSVHAAGNILTVAYRLMAEGGRNPICGRPDAEWYAGCPGSGLTVDVSPLGVRKAGLIFFYAIEYYMTSETRMNTVANFVNQSAFALYNGCSYYAGNAKAEQDAVRDAFAAIGYPRTEDEIPCP